LELELKCSSANRCHHLLKTFWGWHDRQLPDATLIWSSPSGQTYVTTPGSALHFPSLCTPTGELAPPEPTTAGSRCADRAVMMPKRRRTRAQNRAARIATERKQNQRARQAARSGQPPPVSDDEPPPF